MDTAMARRPSLDGLARIGLQEISWPHDAYFFISDAEKTHGITPDITSGHREPDRVFHELPPNLFPYLPDFHGAESFKRAFGS